MPRASLSLLVTQLVPLLVTLLAPPARADEPPRATHADDDARCQALEQEASDQAGLGEAMVGGFLAVMAGVGRVVSGFVPHPGLTFRQGAPGFALSWPTQLPFGPTGSCSAVRPGGYWPLQTNRLVLEPGFLISQDLAVFLRPGYRALVHLSQAPLGFGAGVGTTLEYSNRDGPRASLSPEAVLHVGRCCLPGYTTVALRGDFFFTGVVRQAFTLNVGLTYY